ncbi:MAG: UvrD-helicase domain-containing protein [Halobacteriovoraceae bacterium]|nr:UvrD-helicase domain-containing protein [Halobacteriovoraceae bacterium]
MFDINKLNRQQKLAVKETEGPVMILAGAGSGKTRTLVSRMGYLIEEKNISPYQVLALTFSNKAAGEMRERIASAIQVDIGALQVTTFHSFCARLLRNEANYLGLSRSFTIYDDSESKSVVKSIMGRHGLNTKQVSPFEIMNYFSSLKHLGHYLGRENKIEIDYELEKDDAYYTFFEEYETEIHKANAIDFGGLITAVIQLFETYPNVLESYQNRYKYILVDEYQDTNRAQFELVEKLALIHRNICVVGDEDQSIYSWRGADIRNILEFEESFPEAKILKLEQNYRSSANIIEAASHVIQRNSQRKGKELWTENENGESIQIRECENDIKESQFVASEIDKLISSGVPLNDIAVFYRANAQSRLIEDALRNSNTPYRIVGGIKFYERKEVKDILAYMRLIINEKDSLALSRIINVPARGIGTTTLRKIEEEAIKSNSTLWEIISSLCENSQDFSHIRLSAKVKSALSNFSSLINECRAMNEQNESCIIIFEKVMHESGYYDSLIQKKDYESQARIENLEELGNAIKQFEKINSSNRLVNFLETITLDQSREGDNKDEGEIALMTIHGAKGLEFPYVFVTGLEENVFPSYQSMDNGEIGIEEERRLFYVAMTRAMKRLYLTFAQGRMLFGQIKFNGPSRFLNEIPNKYYDWKIEGKKRSQFNFNDENSYDDDWNDFSQESSFNEESYIVRQTTHEKQKILKSTYPEGSKVGHSLYGEGIVLESSSPGPDEKVVIKFRDGSKKKFMVKFAPLTLL